MCLGSDDFTAAMIPMVIVTTARSMPTMPTTTMEVVCMPPFLYNQCTRHKTNQVASQRLAVQLDSRRTVGCFGLTTRPEFML